MTWVMIDNCRVAPAVAADYARMEADFLRDTGCDLIISSGTRTDAEQEAIFRERYVLVGAVAGRTVYDTRVWNGQTWYRISAAGTVAAPGTSNHQVSGPNGPRSIDIRDSGADAGVMTRGTARDKWMERNAANYHFENEGYKFSEPWHKTWRGVDPYAVGGSVAGSTGVPIFPLAAGQYFGPEAAGDQSISGWHSHNADLRVWQQRMQDRGWTITVDGKYGPVGATTPQGETAAVALAFQTEKGLTADSLIGPATWDAAWTAPVTPATPPATPPPVTIPTPPPTSSVSADNPRGLPSYTPVYPGAKFALVAPLGDGARGTKGAPPVAVPIIIDRAIEHRTGNDGDELDWFSYKNSRSSCPNWYIRKDGTVIELIPPRMKPALTGPEWNWRSVGWELQGAGDGTAAQLEAVCQILAWLASFDGKSLDGIPVSLALTRTSFINHQEALPGTECPGTWWVARMDAQLERAKAIYAEKYADPPVVPDPASADTVAVPRILVDEIHAAWSHLGELLAEVDQ